MCCSPKRFFIPLHVLLGPFMPLITSVFGWIADRAARKHNEAQPMVPAPGSSDAK